MCAIIFTWQCRNVKKPFRIEAEALKAPDYPTLNSAIRNFRGEFTKVKAQASFGERFAESKLAV